MWICYPASDIKSPNDSHHSFKRTKLIRVCVCVCSVMSDSTTHQAPLSWNFPGKKTGVGCQGLSREIFQTHGPKFLTSSALASGFFTIEPPGKPYWRSRGSRSSYLSNYGLSKKVTSLVSWESPLLEEQQAGASLEEAQWYLGILEWSESCSVVLWHVWLFVTPRTVCHQAPLSMGFSRQE